ncbi:MAG: nicotinate (nicotinamide) nucleotide adenylyltransferase [Candidatus Omnitrophica bacterium]|nr:nicotinate (nicotinamide) nucleotide adenylyltransferase [Candidatus Omnitrophota bacterium]
MKIGILGGTFNPPHLGHSVLAIEAMEQLKLDKVLLVPTNIAPHKQNDKVEVARRLDMISLAFSQDKRFKIEDCEIKRGGTSYTIDTIKELKDKYPDDQFYLIIGSDLANDFSSWKDYQEVKKLIKIAVACRNNYPLKEKDDFILLDIAQLYISSSQIRQLFKEGHCIEHLVKDRVFEYIKKHNLYQLD